MADWSNVDSATNELLDFITFDEDWGQFKDLICKALDEARKVVADPALMEAFLRSSAAREKAEIDARADNPDWEGCIKPWRQCQYMDYLEAFLTFDGKPTGN